MGNENYLVLGCESMIGRHLMKILDEYKTVGVSHSEYDLLDFENCYEVFSGGVADSDTVVFNLVGFNGGLPLNLSRPADIYYESAQLNLNVLKTAQLFKVKKIVSIISACSYPDTDHAMKEEDVLKGFPNPSVECHGFAKRTILEFGRQLYKQYNLHAISTILTNCYGDYDRFELLRTKVVGAAIRKIYEAKLNNEEKVVFFGSGNPIRELMYAGDAAACLVQISQTYDDPMNPINIGSDQLVSIKELVTKIANIIGYTGTIMWDTNKPDGQAIRMLDNSKMYKFVNHKMTDFEEGLRRTVKYYEETGRFLSR